MRRISMFFAAFIVASLTLTLGAADIRIAYYDSDQIRTEWSEFADAQSKFDKEVTELQEKADSMQTNLIEMQTEYEQQYLMLSEDKRQEKERLIGEKQAEYQSFLQQIFGEGGLAERRNAELTRPLVERISTVLQEVADAEGYSLILDVAGVYNNIAYIDESLDITSEVIDKLKN